MTEEEIKMMGPLMMNYLEKSKPDMSFDNSKVQELTRSDKHSK
jgi:hypothetical protein